MRLGHRDYQGLQRAILELHEFDEPHAFHLEVPGIFLRLVPGDYLFYTDYRLEPRRRTAKLLDYFESEPRLTPAGVSFAEEQLFAHPFTSHFMGGGAVTALKQSDFLSLNQQRNSSWGEGMRVHLRVDRLISLPVASGTGTAAAINIGRRGKDFTERDRLLLNLVRAHYDQACWKLQRLGKPRATHTPPRAMNPLTPRETEIASWLAQGKTNPEIAAILSASRRTVEKHMEKVLEKLGVENRTAAAVMVAHALPPWPLNTNGHLWRHGVTTGAPIITAGRSTQGS